MPIPPAKERLFPRHGCVFCRSTIHRRFNFNTHLDSHLVDVTNHSNTIAAVELKNHFIPVIAAVRRSSQRHIPGIPPLRRSNYDACHTWKLFTMIHNEHEMQAFKSRKLPTTGQWRAEAKRFLHLPEHSDTPDSFVPFASAEDVGSSASCSDHDSDYDLKPERPVYADSIHQSFGRSRGTRIVFNNLAQADNVGAALAGQSSLNRNRYITAESSKHQRRDGPAGKSEVESSNHAQQHRPVVKAEGESSNHAQQHRPVVKAESSNPAPQQRPLINTAAGSSTKGYDFTTPRRKPLPIIDLCTPEVHDFPTVLVLRGVTATVVVPPGMSLADALVLVSATIGERVLHLRDSRGVVGEQRWEARPVGEWSVAVEWGW